jgi:histidine decarboxylase
MSFYTKPLSDKDRARLDEFRGFLAVEKRTAIGYPCNHNFDYSELNDFLAFSINNVGDPYTGSNFRMNTHEFEREVIDWFAELFDAPKDDYWGYVTNGGTEGNMYGLYLARELHPNGLVYFSEDTHYSVAKILRVLRARNIMIKSQPNGEMDYDDLRETIRIHRDVPPIVFANLGTTMTGAADDVGQINKIFDDMALTQHYIHGDAALKGMILPFVPDPKPYRFSDGVDSLSVSGHKLIGSPIPSGIVLARKQNVDRIARSIEYVGALDTTLTGSRNALSPLYLWYAIKRYGRQGFTDIVNRSLELADYAIAKFKEAGIEAWRNPNSMTVVFPRPPAAIMNRWQIAPYRKIAHIITLPHVDEKTIDQLVDDIATATPTSSMGNSQ